MQASGWVPLVAQGDGIVAFAWSGRHALHADLGAPGEDGASGGWSRVGFEPLDQPREVRKEPRDPTRVDLMSGVRQ